jgi:multidrug efflux pump
VVALSIPLVLAATFLFMRITSDIGLHKISLGALMLALGLLVDDAIIAVEMMVVKMEQGWDRFKAASFAYTSTAFPMLTGTLVTVAGFLPIATAESTTGEYTRSIFQVTPSRCCLVGRGGGVHSLPGLQAAAEPRRQARTWIPSTHTHELPREAVYHKPFYRASARATSLKLVRACIARPCSR